MRTQSAFDHESSGLVSKLQETEISHLSKECVERAVIWRFRRTNNGSRAFFASIRSVERSLSTAEHFQHFRSRFIQLILRINGRSVPAARIDKLHCLNCPFVKIYLFTVDPFFENRQHYLDGSLTEVIQPRQLFSRPHNFRHLFYTCIRHKNIRVVQNAHLCTYVLFDFLMFMILLHVM